MPSVTKAVTRQNNLKSEMQITKTAYARAFCINGFRYYLIRGPISWFAIMVLTFTILSFFSSTPPTMYKILTNAVIGSIAGSILGILTFPIIKRQARKLEQDLTEEDFKSVTMKMERIQPFKEVAGFVVSASILCLLVGIGLSFFS